MRRVLLKHGCKLHRPTSPANFSSATSPSENTSKRQYPSRAAKQLPGNFLGATSLRRQANFSQHLSKQLVGRHFTLLQAKYILILNFLFSSLNSYLLLWQVDPTGAIEFHTLRRVLLWPKRSRCGACEFVLALVN